MEWSKTDKTRKASIIIATAAFGCGIDMPNVQGVIHAFNQNTMMDYIQESGRAGRDGFIALSYVFTCGPIETWQRNKPSSSQMDIESDENTAKFGVFPGTSYIGQHQCRRLYIDSFIEWKNKPKRCSYR